MLMQQVGPTNEKYKSIIHTYNNTIKIISKVIVQKQAPNPSSKSTQFFMTKILDYKMQKNNRVHLKDKKRTRDCTKMCISSIISTNLGVYKNVITKF